MYVNGQVTSIPQAEEHAAARFYTIGATTEGGSQQKAKEIQARLPPYEPNPRPVSIVHKMGLQLLRDPWFNKGTSVDSTNSRVRTAADFILPCHCRKTLYLPCTPYSCYVSVKRDL